MKTFDLERDGLCYPAGSYDGGATSFSVGRPRSISHGPGDAQPRPAVKRAPVLSHFVDRVRACVILPVSDRAGLGVHHEPFHGRAAATDAAAATAMPFIAHLSHFTAGRSRLQAHYSRHFFARSRIVHASHIVKQPAWPVHHGVVRGLSGRTKRGETSRLQYLRQIGVTRFQNRPSSQENTFLFFLNKNQPDRYILDSERCEFPDLSRYCREDASSASPTKRTCGRTRRSVCLRVRMESFARAG